MMILLLFVSLATASDEAGSTDSPHTELTASLTDAKAKDKIHTRKKNIPTAVAADQPLDCKCESTDAPFGCHKYIFRDFAPGCVRVCDECHQAQDLETELMGCPKCDVDFCMPCVEARGIARTGERVSAECQICTEEKTNCGKWCSKCEHIICQDCWSRLVMKGCPYCHDGDGSMKINPVTGNFLGSVMDVAMVQHSRELHASLATDGEAMQALEHAFKTLDARDTSYPSGFPEIVRRTAEIIRATPYDDLDVEGRRTLTLWSTLSPESDEDEVMFVLGGFARYGAQVLPREVFRQLLSPSERSDEPEAEDAQSTTEPSAATGESEALEAAATILPAAAPPAPTEDSMNATPVPTGAPAEDATLRAALLTQPSSSAAVATATPSETEDPTPAQRLVPRSTRSWADVVKSK